MNLRLDQVLGNLPHAYPGPGGAVAVLRRGEVLARHAWGWANAERRIPITAKTLFRICSVSKQFTCALLLDAFPDPSVLDGDVRAWLPRLEQPAPGALHLCHNQSGLRDYWALAMLHGALADRAFGDVEAASVIGQARSLQFAPGTRYAYANQNFRILSEILQERLGRGYAELARERLFDRLGMESAALAADTRSMADGTEGYEGNPASGFRVAENRIVLSGDGGLAASLDDMIAWERHVDAARDDPGALYGRLCAPARFADGRPAPYGFGLRRRSELGRLVTGHGGALRGWRSHRLYAASERVSVVVMFNHMADAHEAAVSLFAAVLNEDRPVRPPLRSPPTWLGAYLEPETELSVRLDALPDGVSLRFAGSAEELTAGSDGADLEGEVRLRLGDEGLSMERLAENQQSLLRACGAGAGGAIGGRYRCEELGAELTVVGDGDLIYGCFSGFLGDGRMELLEPVGADAWALPCPRALDHSPPGDWTLVFRRDADGGVAGVTVGCWLARRLTYVPVP